MTEKILISMENSILNEFIPKDELSLVLLLFFHSLISGIKP